MVNDVVDGISVAIANAFPNAVIYSEPVEQGFEGGSFFISVNDTTEYRMLCQRAIRSMYFDIVYFPKDQKNSDGHLVASKLFPALRQIKLLNGNSLNGLEMDYRINDGVLHFFVKYKAVVYYPLESVEMQEDLTYLGGVK